VGVRTSASDDTCGGWFKGGGSEVSREGSDRSLPWELGFPTGGVSLECSLLGGTPNKSGGSNFTSSSCMDLDQ